MQPSDCQLGWAPLSARAGSSTTTTTSSATGWMGVHRQLRDAAHDGVVEVGPNRGQRRGVALLGEVGRELLLDEMHAALAAHVLGHRAEVALVMDHADHHVVLDEDGRAKQVARLITVRIAHDWGVHALEAAEDFRDLVLVSWFDTVGDGRKWHHMPPSTLMVTPVMYRDTSLARKSTAAATSALVPRRPSAVMALMRSTTGGGSPVPLLVGESLERNLAVHADVVHDHVEAAERDPAGLRERGNARLVGDIGLDDAVAVAKFLQLAGEAVSRLALVVVAGHDMGPGARECERCFPADPASATGDQDSFACKSEVHASPPVRADT